MEPEINSESNSSITYKTMLDAEMEKGKRQKVKSKTFTVISAIERTVSSK